MTSEDFADYWGDYDRMGFNANRCTFLRPYTDSRQGCVSRRAFSASHQHVSVVEIPCDPNAVREVVFDASVHLINCVCFETVPRVEDYDFTRSCQVSLSQPEDEVIVTRDELCDNQIGLEYKAHCKLLPNDTVQVVETYQLYEDGGGSCGGNSRETNDDFTVVLAPDTTQCFNTSNGFDTFCGTGQTCRDSFRVDLCMTNQVAP